MKNTVLCGILVCVLQLAVSSSTPNTNQGNPSQCPQKLNTCQCLYGDSDDVMVDNEEETRTVGLAAATGALGGILATGTALAAYMHFRSSGGGGGGQGGGSPGGGGEGGGGGGGSSGNSGDWRAPRYSRPDSSASSFDSSDSQNPLTSRSDRPDRFNMETRGRPFTGATTTSRVTNIYRHGKVWPAHF